MILKLAWRNVWRQPRRTLLNATAITLVTALMIFLPSFQDGSYRAMIRASVGVLDGYAQWQDPDYLDNPSIRNSFPITNSLERWLSQNARPDSYAERAIAFGLLSSDSRSFGAQVVGVEPSKDAAISTIPKSIIEGRYLEDGGEVILGEGLARNLKASVGERITLIGTGRDGSFAADVLEVVGLFRSGFPGLDRNLAEIPLAQFDEVFAMAGQRHAIVFNSNSHKLAAEAIEGKDLVYRSWRELQPGLLQAIRIDISSAILMYLILVVVICFSLLNSILMSTLERTREFGMMLALGIKPVLLAKIVWVENALILFVGLCGGYILGVGVTFWLSNRGISFSSAEEIFAQYGLSSTLYPHLTGLTLLLGPAVISIIALTLGLYPSVRVQRLSAIEAMRAV